MSILVKNSNLKASNFTITIGRNNLKTEVNNSIDSKKRSKPLNLAKLNQTINQGRSNS